MPDHDRVDCLPSIVHSVANHAGRLIEVRIASPLTIQEVQQLAGELLAAMHHLSGQYVGVVDLLGAHVFPPEVAETLIKLLSGNAPHVIRTALLIGDSAVFALQVERGIRTSAPDKRRAFRSQGELKAWLGEVLTVEEKVALERFLGGG
jgi:hypothetical protein